MSRVQAVRDFLANDRTSRIFWTFLDQGVVSAGAFIVQVVLARLLAPNDYGVFALIVSGLLTLQLVNGTVLFHPMSVQLPTATEDEKPTLLGASILLVLALSLLLAFVLAAGLFAFGLGHLVLPAFAYFLAWQAQEALRRGLFGSLRHRHAIQGDSVTYLGPAAVTAGIGFTLGISIEGVLTIMAACAAVGASLHARALTVARPSMAEVRAVARASWRIGGFPSLGNGFLYHIRLMAVPWCLAIYAGPAATGGFQAAMNIVNLSNPLILGLGNLIPQIVAGARSRGLGQAWRDARSYALIAALPIVIYSVGVFAFPDEVLLIFYGGGSDYLGLATTLRLLLIVGLIGFYIETVLAFLHGAALVGRAAEVNLYGTLTVLLLALPAIGLFGIVGGCAALLAGNLVRLWRARVALSRTRGCPSAVAA